VTTKKAKTVRASAGEVLQVECTHKVLSSSTDTLLLCWQRL